MYENSALNPQSSTLPKTVVFTDYESLYWAMYNQYGEKPNNSYIIKIIKQRAKLEDIYYFGDFTTELQKEKDKLRAFTSNIIDCGTFDSNKKNFTDFIMLDNIYQTSLKQPHIEQYILITGDGHFNSVVAYLRTFQDKEVGIIAVKGSLSEQLKNAASWYLELEPAMDFSDVIPKIIQNIKWTESVKMVPSFSGVVSGTSKFFKLDRSRVTAALRSLIHDGYIRQEITGLPDGGEIRALKVNWDLLRDDSLVIPAADL